MSLYLECTLDLGQFNSILCIVILINFIFTLTWYSKRLDIVNKRGLTGSFTILSLSVFQFFFRSGTTVSFSVIEIITLLVKLLSWSGIHLEKQKLSIYVIVQYCHTIDKIHWTFPPQFWKFFPTLFCPLQLFL